MSSTYLSDLAERLSIRLEEVLTGDRDRVEVMEMYVKSGRAYIALKDVSAIVRCKDCLELHMNSGTIFTVEDDL